MKLSSRQDSAAALQEARIDPGSTQVDWNKCDFVAGSAALLQPGEQLPGAAEADQLLLAYEAGVSVEVLDVQHRLEEEIIRAILDFAWPYRLKAAHEGDQTAKPRVCDRFDWSGCSIVRYNPEKLSGKATVYETRLDADTILLHSEAGVTPAELEEDFGVSPETTRAMLEYVRQRRAKAAA